MNRHSLALTIVSIFLLYPSIAVADGNITVSVSRGNLFINGSLDATGQAFKMVPTGVRDQYELEGLAGTTLNGMPILIVSGITNNVDIKLYSNESVVILSNNGTHDSLDIAGHLRITSTSPTSAVVILDSVFCYKSLSITTGTGEDVVINGDSVFKWKTSIRMGAGEDSYYSIGCGTTEMFVDGGAGDDFLLVEDNLFSLSTLLDGRSGNDYLGIATSSPYEISAIYGGTGKDQFTYEGPLTLLTVDSADAFGGSFATMLDMAAATRPAFATSYFLWGILP